MRKKLAALLCVLALSVSMLAAPAGAAQSVSQSEMLQVLAAMGVLNGDAKGNLNLSQNVTRAAFIKMAVAASPYKDMATSSAYVSPFADVKYNHWAAGYVKTGVDAGWVNGYLDGTFRPDNPVKLEEAVTICLKMLGYTDADFSTGTFPYPQLALYQNLGMNTGVDAKQGQNMTRAQCAQLIYNTLNAGAKSGQPYAAVLGYTVDAAGNIDYLSVVNAELEGPIVVRDGSWKAQIGFTPDHIYRNDGESTANAVSEYDVLYYLEKTRTVWAYHNQVTGLYESAQPNRSNPSSVVVSGVTYTFESSAAAYAMSTTGAYKLGDTVTLLLGRDNTIAAVIDPSEAGSAAYGIVLSTGTTTYTDAQGKNYTAPFVRLLGVDGVTYQYQSDRSGYYKEGDLVKVSYDSAGSVKLSRISTNNSKGLTGTVDAAGTKVGNTPFAANARIMDYYDGTSALVTPSRLAGVKLESGDVAYYELNGSGEIETMILKDVTGDTFTFGLLTRDEEILGYDGNVAGHIYTMMSDGAQVGPITCQGVTFPVSAGGKGVRYRLDGMGIDKMYNLTEVRLISAGNGVAVGANNQRFNIANGVQVYIRQEQSGLGAQYYAVSLDRISDGSYNLTGWYDKVEADGGRLRVIVATPS